MCEYCDKFILEQLDSWQGSACDHILPKSIFPNLLEDENNLALSCKACNDFKRNWDLTGTLPESQQMNFKELDGLTREQRVDFIGRCKTMLVERRRTSMDNVDRIRQILLDQLMLQDGGQQ